MKKTTSGGYKLIPRSGESDNLVLALPNGVTSDGTNLTLVYYSNNTNYKDEWEFPSIIDASLIAFPDDADFSPFFNDAASDLANVGYTNQVTTEAGMNISDLKFVMGISKIILLRTHGSQDYISTNDRLLYGKDLPNLNNTELVLYGACLTASGGVDADNLVTATVNKGARTVIGFENIIEVTSSNDWCMWFFEYYKQYYNDQTKTIDDVCIETDKKIKNYQYYDCDYTEEDGSIVHISVKNFVVAGTHTFPNR